MRTMPMRHFSFLIAAMVACQVHAGDIEKLAVVSTIGDTMSVVAYQPSVGSHLDQNRREVLTLPDDIFDQTATRAATEAVKRLPTAAPIAVVTPTLDVASKKSTTSADHLLPSAEMAAALGKAGATHLLLFVKYRSGSLLKTAHGATGTGELEGLGFYIDRSKRMSRSDTGESGIGFLAPFAYFRVLLVDLSSFEVLKDEAVRASTTLSAARLKEGEGPDPWAVLTADQKVVILQKLIRTETARVVPLLLTAK